MRRRGSRANTRPTRIRANPIFDTMSARTADNREIGRVLANFGAADLRAVIPDPHIRAGLAVLVGTLAEGAIATIRSKNPFSSVQFAKLPNGS